MLEYFTYKKYKKHKAEKGEAMLGNDEEPTPPEDTEPGAVANDTSITEDPPVPVLTDDDERFLERLTTRPTEEESDDESLRPPLPPRVRTPDLSWDSDTESFRRVGSTDAEDGAVAGAGVGAGAGAESKTAAKKANRFSFFKRKDKKASADDGGLDPTWLAVPEPEVAQEKDDLTRVLDDLNLSARNNRAFSLSAESAELVRRFTLVLRDLVQGVPTAVDDLTSLLEDRDGALARGYEKLPKSLKKLVTQLPDKLTSGLGPELLAAAGAGAGTKGLELEAGDPANAGLKGAAKSFLSPKNLAELVTKPGAVVGLLKGIMNALKLRWPAFIGTNVLWSVALFLLLFVLWYCYKRGREVRLEREKSAGEAGQVRDEEALLERGPGTSGAGTPVIVEPDRAD